MKNSTTSKALQVAITSATTVLNGPRSTNAILAVTTVKIINAIQIP
jgi:hypothetical protein